MHLRSADIRPHRVTSLANMYTIACGNFLVRTNIRTPEAHLSPFPSSPCAHFCPLLAQQWFFSSLSHRSALRVCILLSAAGQCEIIRKSLILASVLSSVLPRFPRVSHSFSCGNFLVRTDIRTPEAHLSPFPSSPCAHFCPLLAQQWFFSPLSLCSVLPQPRKSAEKNCSEAGPYYFSPACRTGIMRIGFGVADFLPKRVVRLADTVGYQRRRLPCSNKNRAAQNCSHLRARDFRMIFCRWGAVNSIHIGKPQLRKSAEKNCSEADPYYFGPA